MRFKLPQKSLAQRRSNKYKPNRRTTDWPICARCNAPVEMLTSWDDFETRVLCISARCHGKVEHIRIPFTWLLGCEQYIIGKAFVDDVPDTSPLAQ